MRISLCLGNYATTSYCIPGIGTNVFSIEELCYCLKENAYLLDTTVMNDEVVDWIDRECGLRELSRELYKLVHKKGSLSAFVVSLLSYVGIYDVETIESVEQVLRQGAGLTIIEKKKSQVDHLLKKKKFIVAIREYDNLLAKWQEENTEGTLPSDECLSAIWHNKGVALANMMIYDKAAECFFAAWQIMPKNVYYKDYLAAKRMQLPEKDYVALVAECPDNYQLSLELEEQMKRLQEAWEQNTEYLLLCSRRELRGSSNQQRYFDECEQSIKVMKNNYRDSIRD